MSFCLLLWESYKGHLRDTTTKTAAILSKLDSHIESQKEESAKIVQTETNLYNHFNQLFQPPSYSWVIYSNHCKGIPNIGFTSQDHSISWTSFIKSSPSLPHNFNSWYLSVPVQILNLINVSTQVGRILRWHRSRFAQFRHGNWKQFVLKWNLRRPSASPQSYHMFSMSLVLAVRSASKHGLSTWLHSKFVARYCNIIVLHISSSEKANCIELAAAYPKAVPRLYKLFRFDKLLSETNISAIPYLCPHSSVYPQTAVYHILSTRCLRRSTRMLKGLHLVR